MAEILKLSFYCIVIKSISITVRNQIVEPPIVPLADSIARSSIS